MIEVFENDPGTNPVIDGFVIGDQIRVVVWDIETDHESSPIDPAGAFFPDPNGIIEITTASGVPPGDVNVVATFTVSAVPAPIPIPTMGEWGLIILTLMMMIGATVLIRRRQFAVYPA